MTWRRRILKFAKWAAVGLSLLALSGLFALVLPPLLRGHLVPIAPCWTLTLIPVLATVGLFIIDRKRIPPGHCKKCGYDLRGAISDRCSECGMLIASGVAR